MNNIIIKQGRIVDPANKLDKVSNIYIQNGKISAIADKDPKQFKADKVIDAENKIVCPGLIDLCARFREPGQKHKASIASETAAAAKAGITTACLPPDTDPVIDESSVVDLIQKRALAASGTKIVTLAALTIALKGEQLSEMFTLKQAGCVGVSNAQQPVANLLIQRRAMEYASTHGLTVHINPIEHSITGKGVAHAGKVATRLGLPAIPVAAETIAISQALALAEETGARIHIGRLSAEQSIDLIVHAQQRGVAVTADIAAHQLHLTDMDILDFNSACHVMPPLRGQRDKAALIEACKRGIITAICSDHQPLNADAKLAPFASTEPGISSLETLLPLVLRLVETEQLPLSDAIAMISHKPADILGLDAGHLSIGAHADICIIDPALEWELTPDCINSQGKNTPFYHWNFTGRAIATLINGKLVD